MARDHALALTLPAGEAVLRLYGWSRPTLSLGRNEPARGRWDLDALSEAGVPVVRRPTGGRAVLHDREVTYSVVTALPERGGLRAVYHAVGGALVEGLRRLGADVDLASGAGPVPTPDHGPCFRDPAADEVVASGRKLVGSAQARIGDRLLQHGSVLLHDDQAALGRFRRDGVGAGDGSAPATLAELLGRSPEPAEVGRALLAGFAATLAGDWPAGPEERTFLDETRRREQELRARYGADDWTWRR
jgi:lipoate-protein ligase A